MATSDEAILHHEVSIIMTMPIVSICGSIMLYERLRLMCVCVWRWLHVCFVLLYWYLSFILHVWSFTHLICLMWTVSTILHVRCGCSGFPLAIYYHWVPPWYKCETQAIFRTNFTLNYTVSLLGIFPSIISCILVEYSSEFNIDVIARLTLWYDA